MRNTEIGSILRKQFKEQFGATRNDISVTTDMYSINVTIKNLAYANKFNIIESLANQHRNINRDEATGEILLGGNTYVNVSISEKTLKEEANKYIKLANAMIKEADESDDYCVITRDITDKLYISYSRVNKAVYLHKIIEIDKDGFKNTDTIERYYFYDAESIATVIALANTKHKEEVTETKVEETIISTTDIEEVATEENTSNSSDNTISNVQVNNNLSITVNYNTDKNGIELSFNDKPSEEIRMQLKENSFRWSKYQKIWYAKDTEERRSFVNTLTNNKDKQQENNNTTTTINIEALEPTKIELTEVTEENYPISKEISKRENEGHWTFRTKERDHQQEILSYLKSNNKQIQAIADTTKDINLINSMYRYCNYYNKRYYENYYKRLRNDADNPSWAVTGRAGRNSRKDAKMNSRYDNLMKELISLEDEFKSKLSTFKHKISTNKKKKYLEQVQNCTTILNFKRSKIKINVNVLDSYFNLDDTQNTLETTLYTTEYNNTTYHLIKTWGRYEAINSNGKSIELIRVDNLGLAKQILTHYIINNSVKVA